MDEFKGIDFTDLVAATAERMEQKKRRAKERRIKLKREQDEQMRLANRADEEMTELTVDSVEKYLINLARNSGLDVKVGRVLKEFLELKLKYESLNSEDDAEALENLVAQINESNISHLETPQTPEEFDMEDMEDMEFEDVDGNQTSQKFESKKPESKNSDTNSDKRESGKKENTINFISI